MSPQTAWLLIRGLRTLDIRLNQIEKNRIAVENYLDSHPKVQEIIHPFHHKHPQKQLAQKQMSRGNGLFSVILKNTEIAQLEQFCNQLNFFKLAVSWGGHESLIFPALAIQAKQEQLATPVNMMRMYTGLDDAEVLIKDLAQALELL